MASISLAAPETSEVEDTAAEREERVFGLPAGVGGVVGAVTGYPWGLGGDGEEACAAELNECWFGFGVGLFLPRFRSKFRQGGVGMSLDIRLHEIFCLLSSTQWESDENCFCSRESTVGF